MSSTAPSRATSATAATAPSALRVAAPPMIAVTVLLLAVGNRYGPHWDELYFRMLPLRWWYDDQPPLVVWLTWLAARISDQLWVQRLPAIVAAAAGALVAAQFPRVLGAGIRTQRLAAWAHAFTVYPLLMGHIFTTATLDLLTWEVVILLVLRATLGQPRFLVWAGAVAGLACWNKLLVVVLLVALLVSLCVTDRWLLRTRSAAIGASLFVALAAPQLMAQLGSGLPMAQVSAGLVAQQGMTVRLVVIPALALFLGPPLLRVWMGALVEPWRSGTTASRFLLPTVVLVVIFTIAFPSQPYYPVAAALPALSMGWASPQLARRWSPRKRHLVVAANALVACLFCLPLLPATELSVSALARVNPTIRDQVGWSGMAQAVAAERRPGEGVISDSYALAGAVHHFGSAADRAAVHSGQNALWHLGPPTSERVLLIGEHAVAQSGSFASCVPAGRLPTGPVVHPQLTDLPMLHCEGPERGWEAVWPTFRRLSG